MKSIWKNTLVSFREKSLAPFRGLTLNVNSNQGLSGKRILILHGIDDTNCTRHNTRFISKKKFESLLVLLKQHCNLISITDYCNDHIESDKLNIAITFDDGYFNNLSHALPLLEKYQVPACIFCTAIHLEQKDILWADLYDLSRDRLPKELIIEGELFRRNIFGEHIHASGRSLKQYAATSNRDFILQLYQQLKQCSYIKDNEQLSIYWKLLSQSDIKELSQHPLITIGSHSVLHLDYPSMPEKNALQDMEDSKNALEKCIGKNVEFVAFPRGTFNAESVNLAQRIGFRYLFVEYSDNNKSLPGTFNRLGINPYISAKQQYLYIRKGSY